MYSKIEVFAFADFYSRWAKSGLTMDEMFENFLKYSKTPRDISHPIIAPGRIKPKVVEMKPPADTLKKIFGVACDLSNVTIPQVNSGVRKREFVTVRQWVAYVGVELGFEPPDFQIILNWERSGIYHKRRKALDYAKVETVYRNNLNILLNKFGGKPLIA